ncbi:F-actin-monooxygenase MICAL2 isoform X5 [Crotalus tigris]|uniref:F-actin-monooxygenase MICAL2 isoform X5 n=1 Tax=Crotalus tigris TaxID=88082 RepID=UPI00192FB11C|nr:F-actin-monooxygenase MICAL2 isoform X5 [Crotalus tigris]
MGEKDNDKYNQADQIFESFVQASTCKGSIQAFNILTRHLELDPLDNRNFYAKLKSKVTSWKAKALWNKLDKRASHKEYKRGKSCTNTKCLIVGGGPCGLRTAIELAFLGAKVVVIEKRDAFSRNNVLHLWPFTIHDLRSLGAKKFYGKFCAGSIDHISIRQLQLVLFKIALLLGVEIHVNLEFVKVLEPPEDQENQKIGWKAEFLPMDHPLSEFEFHVIIGADGRRNSLEGFKRKEFRGKLAIAITANFINRNTTAEAKVEEISGVAFIFNQKFFQDLKEETGIDLENIVYYKDSTHYFVMTAKKQSLLEKGVIINDFIDTEMLLCMENVDQNNLLSYAREAADFATDYQLPALDFAINHYGQPDVAMFDFTSMYASENAALVRERHRHQLLVALVGDSLVEPFWPMGTGCARGFLAAFDTAWMVKSWAQGKPPLDILAERESIYRLLPQTTPENITKNFDQYTIDPATRYPNLNSSCVRPHQVKHLYITNELQPCLLERANTIRRSIGFSKHEYDIRPNKLLTWCQKQTEGYKNVNVTDLTSSWKSGLALCAIMHHFRPDLIDFDSLNEEDAVENNQLAFDIAEREFGIPPVTTGKEMVSAVEPDKLSMVMYLSKFYELFRGTPLRAVGTVTKQNGERIDPCSAKSSNFVRNNHINLTFPRKRIPKVEENETSKRRRKSLISFEESSNHLNQERNSSNQARDLKETINRNRVKSMATQLLAKFEENAPNVSLRRQEPVKRSGLFLSSESPINPHFAKSKETTDNLSSPSKKQIPFVGREATGFLCSVSQSQAIAKMDCTVRKPLQPLSDEQPLAKPLRCIEPSEPKSRVSETLASSCPAALALSGVLQRLQDVEEKINQKKAQSIANREFHKKSIKEKAAHLASLFGCVDIPKVNKYAENAKLMTIGKVSHGIDAVAQILVNLYRNDHKPLPASLQLGSLKREFPQTIGGSDICYFCKRRVYIMERLSAEGHFFHRECFRCVICATTLRLATYTFDAEEGNFYCKLHFAQCKTKNTQRKKRAEIKEEAGFQRHQEPMCQETSSESAFATSSSSDDQSSEYYNSPVDESISPKKCKNIPHLDLRSSLPSSEWTLVRFTPEEEKAHHKPMAVQVLVTSDGSSSELECDLSGNSAISASSEKMLSLPEPIWNCLPSSKSSPLFTTNLEKGKDCLEKSKAANALQRAYTLRDSSSSKKYQNWKKKIQSNFPLLYNKKSGSSSKDASASLQQEFEESCFKTELTYPNSVPETKAHFQPHSAEFHSTEKATNEPEQIPFYIPHHCCVDSYPVARSQSLSHADWATIPSCLKPGVNQCGTNEQYLGNEAVNNQQLTSRLFTKNSDTSSINLDEGDKIASEPAKEQQDRPLNKVKSKIMRKLTLSMERQARARALRNSQPEEARIAHQDQGLPGPKNPYFTRDEHIAKQPSYVRSPEFSDNLLPVWDPEQQCPKYGDKCPKRCIAAQPKLSLKLMANVIRKSILEGREKSQDVHTKCPLENTFNFSHNLAHLDNWKNTKYQEDSSAQMQELIMLNNTEQVLEPRSSVISNFSSSVEDFRFDDKSYFPKYDVHPRSSNNIHRGHSYSNKVDVPTLLERFTLKENARKSYIDCNQKNMLHPSLRHKSKSDNSILDDPVERNKVWNLFSNLRNKEDDSIKSPLLMPAMSPTTIFDVDKVLSNSSKGEYLGSEGLTARKQATISYCSSSSDGEWECKPSPQLLVKSTLRRNKKLAKETKQLVKQEELKRLHKAQAIQRLLEEVEEQQRALEVYGVQLERKLRGEADSSTQDESELLHEWFELVLEKNRLMRYEAELLIIAKDIELEDHQNDRRRTETEN